MLRRRVEIGGPTHEGPGHRPVRPVRYARPGGDISDKRHGRTERRYRCRRRLLETCACIWLCLIVWRSDICATTALAWPEYFVPPVSTQAEDTSRFTIGTRQEVYGQTIESRDSLQWRYADSAQRFLQKAQYELIRHYETKQFLDLGGSYARTRFLGREITFGLDWAPWLKLRQASGSYGGFQGTIDVGPMMKGRFWDIPVGLRAGFSATGWNENISVDLREIQYADFHGAAGFYGGLRLGEPGWRPFEEIPLYGSLSAFGRSLEQAGLAVVLGSAFYGEGVPSGDSLFVYIADSLGDGRVSLLSEAAEDKTKLTDTPWRIENALHLSTALKGASRLFFIPSLIYALDQRILTYPDEPERLDDRKNTVNTLTILAETDPDLVVRYHAGLQFQLEDEDKLFRAEFPAVVERDSLDASMLDSLRVNNEDYRGTAALMEHSLTIPFRNGMALMYEYRISRNSFMYPNETPVAYWGGAPDSSMYNDRDIDRQRQTHNLHAVLLETDSWQGAVRGQYSREVKNYIRASRSGNNRTDRTYLVVASLSSRREERFQLSEMLTAEAKTSEWMYPSVHQGPGESQAPDYSRKFASSLKGHIRFSDQWMVKGRWYEAYWDEGRWYGAEYFVDTAEIDTVPEHLDYYAIERKSTEYTVGLSVRYNPRPDLALELGSTLQDIFHREYHDSTYETFHNQNGYLLKPYIEFAWRSARRWNVSVRIERTINTYDDCYDDTYYEDGGQWWQKWDWWRRDWDINAQLSFRL